MIFFILMIAVGLLLIYMDWYGSRHSDSMPTELAHHGSKGLAAVAIGIVGLICLWLSPGHARDLDGRYAQSPLKPWFDNLKSKGGTACCDAAEGIPLSDENWKAKDGHYEVRLQGYWIRVPDDAVVTEPNLAGKAMVWPFKGTTGVTTRCFMPGPVMR